MDGHNNRDARWSSMTDDELADATTAMRFRADAGDAGAREYLCCLIMERAIRDLDSVRAMIGRAHG